MDYKMIKLKSGLEIHQQLDTGKLFSASPSFLQKDKPDFTIIRKLHQIAGEEGEVDIAVKYESSLDKNFYYEGYNDTTSLIELDEEPPKLINRQALEEAIKIALLLNCEIYQNTQIMRKTVIDGSNTSGFQRTVLIAHSGSLETSFGSVPIESLALEEDSARLISKNKTSSTYRLDRLGIPLVEIATSPVLKTPEQIKETALKLGEILRSCKVKRGLGTIRQDVNISSKGHDRVELKGFQDQKIIIKTIDLEIERQQEEVAKNKTEGEVRNTLPDGKTEFLRPLPGKARMYPETDLPLLKISRELINKLKTQLPKLRTEIKSELQKKGLSPELINLILSSPENLDEFNTLTKLNKDADLIAKMITLWRNEIATKLKLSQEKIISLLTERILEQILESLNNNKISKTDIKPVMEKVASGSSLSSALKIEKVSDDETEETIRKIIKSKPGLRPNAYMGLIMKELKGKLDAKKTMEIINKILVGK